MANDKLGFEPLNSPKLNETFKSLPVENIDKKKEFLISLWIDDQFADQLNKMFNDIKASTSEIMDNKDAIIAANNRVENQSELSRYTKTNLAMMKNSA